LKRKNALEQRFGRESRPRVKWLARHIQVSTGWICGQTLS